MNMEIDPLSFTEEELEAALCRESLEAFCMRANKAYSAAAHHKRLIDVLEQVERGELKRVIVCMPPRHGKSHTSTEIFPAWFLGRNPMCEVIVGAYGASLAEDFSRKARDTFSEHAPAVFGEALAKNVAGVEKWGIEGKRGMLYALGVGGPATGKGADLFLVDDPFKDWEAAESEVQRKAVIEWFRSVARTRLMPGGRIVVVQTRWLEEDLAGVLLKEAQEGGEQWTLISMPMVDDEDGSEVDAQGKVKLLWPERWACDYGSQEQLNRAKTAFGPRVWQCLYQQRPVPSKGNKFQRGWWNFYRRLDSGQGRKRPDGSTDRPTRLLDGDFQFDEMLLSWDFTFDDKKDSDFVVGLCLMRKGADKYIVERARDRMNITKMLEEFKGMARRHPYAHAKLVEEKANGAAVITMCRSEISGILPMLPEHKGNKIQRAAAIEPQVAAGNVYLPEDAWWLDEWMDEFAAFPKGKNDDQVDALSQALNYWIDSDAQAGSALCSP